MPIVSAGLVYLDGATDPTLTADVVRRCRISPRCRARSNRRLSPDRSSFEAFSRRRDLAVTFPEAEWRQQFAANADGSVGESILSPAIRRAITVDPRMKPDYARVRRCW